jgi:hypothetical protein
VWAFAWLVKTVWHCLEPINLMMDPRWLFVRIAGEQRERRKIGGFLTVRSQKSSSEKYWEQGLSVMSTMLKSRIMMILRRNSMKIPSMFQA